MIKSRCLFRLPFAFVTVRTKSSALLLSSLSYVSSKNLTLRQTITTTEGDKYLAHRFGAERRCLKSLSYSFHDTCVICKNSYTFFEQK